MQSDWAEIIIPYLSVTALASTVGFFLCGLQICYRIRQLGTADSTNPAPFFMSFISCAFFIRYGVLKSDSTILYTNFVGCLLQFIYIVYFYYQSRKRRWLQNIILIEFLLLSALFYYSKYSTSSLQVQTENIGNICILLNILSVGAPLSNIQKVVATKSSESMPFPLCFASFVVCAQWLLYGYLLDDIVITVPNLIATVLSILQLSLIYIYPTSNQNYSKIHDHI